MAKGEIDNFSPYLTEDYAIFDNLLEGCQIISRDWVYIYVNNAAAKQNNIKKDFLLGKTVMEVYPGIEQTELFSKFEKCMNERVHVSFENQFTFPDGQKAVFESKLEPIPEGMFILSIDITERKRTEEALKESYKTAETDRNRLETLIKTIPSAVVILEQPDGRVSFINERAKELYGMDPTGLKMEERPKVGLLKLDGTPYHGEELPASRPLLTGEVVHNEDLIIEKSDGKQIFVSGSSAPIYNPKGEVSAVIGVFDDISERKKLEEELRESRDNLEEKVEERTAEIEEAYQIVKENEIKLQDTITQLERSNKELQSFAYITSHDLQEPLRTIVSYAQLIQRRYEGKLDADADEFLEFMVQGATRMKGMIQGLREYSRVESAEKEFVKTDMNLKVEKAIENLKSAIDESQATITYDKLPIIFADPDQMVRVFQNLISNAIKFKKPQFPPRIHISAKLDNDKNEYVFSVEDNGIGIEPQYIDKIFKVFRRLHSIGKYEGTGIGLPIIRRIIERHDGRIWVESEYGVGSTFYFTIPIKSVKK
ncbi:PAS domain-containing sensor histidine kinase [Methanobacterium oryzae]|uniref:PAS domain-containing sensor histidine kinase n=1 Tax=Methanobacterium oryzae TaxID=69540 RepID=UPI003D1FC33F